jgi:hypothetical protein
MLTILLFVHLIMNASNFTNVSSTSGLLQSINSGLSADCQCGIPNLLGVAMLFIIFVVITAVSAFKADLPVAAAFGAFVATVAALLLQTPGLALIDSTMVYVFGGLTVMFILLAMVAGTKSPFR